MPSIISPRNFTQEFDVRAYGAVGDGVANDKTAFQAAFDAAGTYSAANKNAKVVIPPGQYKITAGGNSLNMPANTTIEAYGAYIFSGASDFYMINNYLTTGADYTTGRSNIKILGGIWDAVGQNAANTVGYNIFTLSSARNITFKDVTLRNVAGYHAIDINTMDGVVIDNCRFEGYDPNGVATPEIRESIQIQENGASPCINISVINCYAGPAIDASGLGSPSKLVGSHNDTAGTVHSGITIIGNRVVSPGTSGIAGRAWKNVTISNNVITGAGSHAISFTQGTGTAGGAAGAAVDNTGSRITITGNLLDQFVGNGIFFDGQSSVRNFTGAIISNNTIDSTVASLSGIRLEFVSSSSVTGNSIRNVDQHGIYLVDTCDDTVVSNNSIQSVDLNGIQITVSNRCTITTNRIYDTGTHGILISGISTKNLVDGNLIRGASRTTNNASQGINVSSAANIDNVISNNRIGKTGSTGNGASDPILFAGTTSTGCQLGGNSYEGFTETIPMKTEYSAGGQATTSNTYVSLATAQSVTMTTGTSVMLNFGAVIDLNTAVTNVGAFVGVDITGNTTRAPDVFSELKMQLNIAGGTNFHGYYKTHIITGLTPGTNTFTLKFHTAGGTSRAFDVRHLYVTPVIGS